MVTVAAGRTMLPAVKTPAVVILAAVSNPPDVMDAAVRAREPPVIAPVATFNAVAETVPAEEVMFPVVVIAPAVILKLPAPMVTPAVVERPPVIARVPLVGWINAGVVTEVSVLIAPTTSNFVVGVSVPIPTRLA